MAGSLTAKSKFLSMVLRHRPQVIGLELDDEGWAEVSKLSHASREHGIDISMDDIRQIIAGAEKQRFELSDDQGQIRAVHGHSIPVNLALVRSLPPAKLYHGTSRHNLTAIFREGLQSQDRQYVHLSQDIQSAFTVGLRHAKDKAHTVVLEVDAAEMNQEGLNFYRSASEVWLTGSVPPGFLKIHGDETERADNS